MKISVSIPFVMEPVYYKNVRYVDGALYSNCYLEFIDYYFNDIKQIHEEKIKDKHQTEDDVKAGKEDKNNEKTTNPPKEEDSFVNLLAIELESDDILNLKKENAQIPESFPLKITSPSEVIWQYGYKIIRGIALRNQHLQMQLSKLKLNSGTFDWLKSSIFTIYVNHNISTEFHMTADDKRKLFRKGYDIAKEEKINFSTSTGTHACK